ncbi:MAG: hypothetical protein ACREH3_14535, partial [Geminicoccales bacterium]
MDPEQYLIANETCIVDVSKAQRELGWAPAFKDEDMLIAAYRDYRMSKRKYPPQTEVDAAEAPYGEVDTEKV